MGINLGQGLAAFAGGAIDRAKEIDKAVADRVKTLKASKPDELLKSRYKKEYEKFDKEQATLAKVTSAGGPNTEPGQMELGGFGTNTAEYRKQLAADPTLFFKMRDAPTAPKYTPTDYNLNGPNTIQRLWASATGDDENVDKGEIEATAGTTTSFERGEAKADTPEGKERRDTWRRNIPKKDDRLAIEKEADVHFLNFSDPEMFPEYKDASVSALKRLAYDVAAGTVKVTADGLPYNIQQETVASYGSDLFKKKEGEQDKGEGYAPIAQRKATKDTEAKERKDADDLAKKVAQEARQRESTQAYKVTAMDIANAGNRLKASTFTAYTNAEDKRGTEISFMDELSQDHQNSIETAVAGNINAIVAQARISPTAASTLAMDIAKTGLSYNSDITGPDFMGNNFTYNEPLVDWAEILSTYNKYKTTRPNTTYDEVLKKLLENKGL